MKQPVISKTLPFASIDLFVSKNKEDLKATDLQLEAINTTTALITYLGVTFHPDPRIVEKNFPLHRPSAINVLASTISGMWHEYYDTLPEEEKGEGSISINDDDVWGAFEAAATRNKLDVTAELPRIELPLAAFWFVPEPTLENFKSLWQLPKLSFELTHIATGVKRVFWLDAEPRGALMEHHLLVQQGKCHAHAGMEGVDHTHVLALLADRLYDVFSAHGYKVPTANVGDQLSSRGFGRDRATGTEAAVVEKPFAKLAAAFMNMLMELPSGRLQQGNSVWIADEVMSPKEGEEVDPNKRAVYLQLNMGHGLEFRIAISDDKKSYSYRQPGYEGYITFVGQRRTFSLTFNHRNQHTPGMFYGDITKTIPLVIVEQELVKATKKLSAMGLNLYDLNSIEWVDSAADADK